MPLPAPSNAFTPWTSRKEIFRGVRVLKPSGQVINLSPEYYVNGWARSGKSSNPVNLPAGSFEKVLRKSSNYGRTVVKVTPRTMYSISNASYTETGYIGSSNPLIGLYYTPYFGYNTVGIISNVANEAKTKALLKIKENRAQLGADLAEAKKTADMVATDFIQLLKAYKAARRGNWGSLPKILGMSRRDVITGKAFANRWLEYQYGWKPLMSSIYDGVTLLREPLSRAQLLTAKASARDDFSFRNVDAQLGSIYGLWSGSGVYTSRCKLVARVTNQYTAQIERAGLINPLSIAWELTPFSFVFDWFCPVGSVLEALSATVGLQFVTGDMLYRYECKGTYRGNSAVYSTQGGGDVERFGMRREVLSGFPAPLPYFVKSPFSNKRSGRIWNALALFRTTSR